MTREEFSGRLLRLSALVSRMKSPSRTSGSHQDLLNAGGIEFVDMAPFRPGDDVREFSAVLTEKFGQDIRRINRDERDLQAVMLADIRASLCRGYTRSVREFIAEVAGVLGLTALNMDDTAGVAALSLAKTMGKPKGDRNKHAFIAKLYAVLDEPSETRDACICEALERAVSLVPPFASVYVISDWMYGTPDLERPAAPLREQRLYRETRTTLEMLKGSRVKGREVALIAVHDQRDCALPPYAYRLRSSGGGPTGVVDGESLRQRKAREALFAERQEWLNDLERVGVDHCILETDAGFDYLASLTTFFAKRRT